ncbi:Spermidine synthase [Gryllus bimaculatus]|nr:Spermidine synthase [Gryllus bimaculatus]
MLQSLSCEISRIIQLMYFLFDKVITERKAANVTKNHGRALILDGIIQCTEADEFTYQEMIAFLPLCCHKSPKKVLVIGGGDGGVAREVAKHPYVESITQVEIDAEVLEVSKKYLPFMGKGLSHPKLTLHVADGFDFMAQHQEEFDVIITDSSDPVGPAVSLFQKEYFEMMRSALKPGGIVCSQSGTFYANIEQVTQTLNHCRSVFASAALAYVTVPTYPTGQIAFVLGSCDPEIKFDIPSISFTDDELEQMQLRYYSSDIHRAAFVLPRFAKKILSNESSTL